MTFTADEELYESNWELLRQQDPQTAYRLYSSAPSPAYRFCMSQKGELNLMVGAQTLHSHEGALAEAEVIAADKDLEEADIIYFYGIGLGYPYQALKGWLRQKTQRHLVFFEDDLDVLRSFLYTATATEFLQDEQTTLGYFHDIHTDNDSLYRLCARFANFEPQFLALPFYERAKRILVKRLCYKTLSDTSLIGPFFYEALSGGVKFFENYYANLLCLYDSYLGTGLIDKFKNIPAIICGAGPSLEKQLPFLKTLTNRALIFGGGSSFNTLTANGILPHFGAGIDPNPEQAHRLLTSHGFQVPFFYRQRLSFEALNLVQGPKLYIPRCLGYDIPDWVDEQLGIPASPIDEGQNVIHFCTEIARLMGCNPIIFVGLDLAFTENQLYAKGISTHPLWLDGRSAYEIEPNTRVVQSLDFEQKPITTKWNWLAESHWYSSYTQSYPEVQFFNATEGGLAIAPVPNIPLKDIAAQKLTQEYDLAGLVHAEIQCHPIGVTRGKILQVLGTLKQALIESQKICTEIIQELTAYSHKIYNGSIQPISPYPPKAILAETVLHENIAYQKLLKNYEGAFRAPTHAHFSTLKRSFNPTIEEQTKIVLGKYHFLNNTLKQNLDALNHAVLEFIRLPPYLEMTKPQVRQENCSPVKIDGKYCEGKLEGPCRIYAGSGQLLSESHFIAGKRHGDYRQFYLSGALYSLQRYQNNELEGKQEYFYEGGQPKAILNYRQGLLEGSATFYNCDGTTQRALHYQAGKRHGSEKMWNSEGRLLVECHYANGVANETARQWDNEGKLTKEVLIKVFPHLFDLASWDAAGNVVDRFTNGIKDFTDLYEQKNKESSAIQESIDFALDRLSDLMQTVVDESPNQNGDLANYSGVKKDIEGMQEQLKQVHLIRAELEDKMKANLEGADQARQQNIDIKPD